MADLYLEELNNYLRGSEWRESIEVFTTSNCRAFSRIKELSHHHHSIWKNFQEIVEAILDVALESVGGSIETLEKALDEVQHQPSRGPRDDLIKEVISQLLSFDDFESFCTMMNETYTSQVDQASPNDEIFKFDLLINMGFAWDAVNSAIEKGGKDASLDEILEMLSSSNNNSESAVDLQVKVDSYHRKLEIDPNVGALQKFADELSEELQFDHDFNDLNAKFALAESMVDAVQDGVIHQNSLLSAAVEDGELGVEHLMRWANDMKTLREDIQTAYEEQIDSRELCFNCEEGLLVWFRQLEEERLQLDRTALAGTMLSDSECRRMAELDRIAAEVGTEDEQHLHSLISNHDRLTKDIDTLHRKCGVLVAANRNNGVGISRENLEELYLFLKQQVANGLELSFVADELFIKVRSLVGEHTDNRASGETINLLLDLHVLEDELIMLKQQIQHLVGGSPMRPVDQPSLEEPTIDSSINELHLFLNEIDLNGLPSEYKADDKMATVRPIESKGYGDYSPNQGFSNQSSLTADAKNKDTSSNEVSQGERFQGVGVSAGGEFKSSDAANTGDRKGKERSLENPELIQLKSQHQDALKSLQSSLAADRSNRLRQLEDRLLRRKAAVLQHKQKMQQGGEEYDTVGNMLQAELDDIIVELEKERHQGEVRSNAIISGFKRKCVGEMGVLKKNLKNNSEYSTQNASDDAGKREAQLAAATALKKRYALESDQLAASFDLQKRQQRLKLEQMLARKRQQISDRIGSKHDSKSDSDLSIEEEKVIQQMVEIEKDLQNQQEMAMKNAQESLLLSLSAVYLEEDTLKTITKREEEDVDNYLEDSSDMENTVLRQWIDRVTGMTSAYVESADEIQTQLRSQGRESSATSALVTDLVAGAFENQLTNPFFAPQSLSGTRKGFGGVGKGFGGSVSGFDVQRKVDRNAARASILDEFVKAKKEQEEELSLSSKTLEKINYEQN